MIGEGFNENHCTEKTKRKKRQIHRKYRFTQKKVIRLFRFLQVASPSANLAKKICGLFFLTFLLCKCADYSRIFCWLLCFHCNNVTVQVGGNQIFISQKKIQFLMYQCIATKKQIFSSPIFSILSLFRSE